MKTPPTLFIWEFKAFSSMTPERKGKYELKFENFPGKKKRIYISESTEYI